jgi:DNA-damage-inducible protein D
MENENKLVVFDNKNIRRVWHNEQWHFSIIDIIEVLTGSLKPSNYWDTLKRRENQLSAICGKFKFLAPDGKMRSTECANTEGVFRIIMSVPSPKAEPFKLWLARVGQERLEEMENPELATERAAEYYRLKGYTDEWIERRLQSIEVRKQLTEEWKNRGVKEGQEYSILTAKIAKATFGLNPTEHKDLKGLKKPNQNLRDHMTPLELIFTALSEEATRTIAIRDDAQGFEDNHEAARKGGEGAKTARENFEKTTGVKVVSPQNYLDQPKNNKDLLEEGSGDNA